MKRIVMDEELETEVMALRRKTSPLFADGRFEEMLPILLEAWEKIPEPRLAYSESFHVARMVCESALGSGDLELAQEWVEIYKSAATFRIDSGERVFMAARLAYANEDLDTARALFEQADKMSGGRRFQNPQYAEYYEFYYGGPAELDDSVHDDIAALSEQGQQLFERGEFDDALNLFNDALDLVPNPKTNWEASTWIYAAIGDCHFVSGRFKKSADSFYDALNCPDGMGNPFLHLRLGQSLFELGDLKAADDQLIRAYMAAGDVIFEGEDSKYLEHLEKNYEL